MMKYMNSIQSNLTEEEYRSHPALGSTQVKTLSEIQVFLHQENNPLKETPDMHRGTLSHASVLEKLGKEQLVERHPYEKRAGWKEEDHDLAYNIKDSAYQHPLIGRILQLGKPEVAVFAELCGVQCKGKIDWYQDLDDDFKISTKRGGVPFKIDASAINLYDFKTLGKGKAHPDEFMKYVGNNGLHVQAAFYFDIVKEILGHEPARFSWIVVEREPPHMCAVYNAEDWLELGRYEYTKNLQHYRDYLQLDPKKQEALNHSGYHEDERVLKVPGWIQKQHEQRGFDEY
jgi:hypothetical protein